MGLFVAGGPDFATTVVTGTVSSAAAGNSGFFLGSFNVTCFGVFVATIVVEQSADGAVTWVAEVNKYTNTPMSFSIPFAILIEEYEPGIAYRIRVSAYTSGTINYRLASGRNFQTSQEQRLS